MVSGSATKEAVGSGVDMILLKNLATLVTLAWFKSLILNQAALDSKGTEYFWARELGSQ